MKTLKSLLENYECNPGNSYKLGVTNHLIPVNNIIMNVRNIFGQRYSIVVEPCDDNVSLKLHSSKFFSKEELEKVLNDPYLGKTTLKDYIMQQGLTDMKLINLGSYWVAYFGPNDIRAKKELEKPVDTAIVPKECNEMRMLGIDDVEMDTLFEGFDDEELEDKTKEQLLKFINGTDKVKCANKLAELLADDLSLPEDYYFKGVKDSDGNESIALRYKYTKRRPFGKTVELSKSLLNIYKAGEEAVWVEAFLTRDKNSDEMNEIVENVLKLIGATPTDDPCVYAIAPSEVEELKKDVKASERENENEDDLNKKEGEEISGNLKTSEENKDK